MDEFQRLLQRCDYLKKLIRKMELRKVDKHQAIIHSIQLRHLKEELSHIGRQLVQLSLYKKKKE